MGVGRILTIEEKIAAAVDKRSRFGKNVFWLLEQGPSVLGVRAVREILEELYSRGVRRMREPAGWAVVGYEEAPKHKRAGRSVASGQELRFVNRVELKYERKKGKRGSAGDIVVSDYHADFMPMLFDEAARRERSNFRKWFTKLAREIRRPLEERVKKEIELTPKLRGILKRQYGIDPDQLANAPRVLKYAGDIFSGQFEKVEYWLDQANHGIVVSRMLELRKEGRLNDYPKVLTSLARIASPYSSADASDFAAVRGWALQFLEEPAEGLIGTLKKDLLYLNRDKEAADEYGRFSCREEFSLDVFVEPAKIYRTEKITAKKASDILGQEFVTVAEAVGLEKAYPDLVGFRKARNTKRLEELFNSDGGNFVDRFMRAYSKLKGVFEDDTEKIAEAKGEEADTWLDKRQYNLLKRFFRIATADDKRSPQKNLALLLAMPDADEMFGDVAILNKKLLLGREIARQMEMAGEAVDNFRVIKGVVRTPYVLAKEYERESGVNIGNIVRVLEKSYFSDAKHLTDAEKRMLREAGLTAPQFYGLKIKIIEEHKFGLVAAKYTRTQNGKEPVIKRLEKLVGNFSIADEEISRKIDYISKLKSLELDTSDITAEGHYKGQRRKFVAFDINNYSLLTGARGFLSKAQRGAIERVYRTLTANKELGELVEEETRKKFIGIRENILEEQMNKIFYGHELDWDEETGHGRLDPMKVKLLTSPNEYAGARIPASIRRGPEFIVVGGMRVCSPEYIKKQAEEWVRYKIVYYVKGGQAELLRKLDIIIEESIYLEAVTRERSFGFSAERVREFADDIRKNYDKILVHENLVRAINFAYGLVEEKREKEKGTSGEGAPAAKT